MISPKIKLVLFTAGTGYEESGAAWLTDENLRKWARLSVVFEVIPLAVRASLDRRRTARLPEDMTVTWLPPRTLATFSPSCLVSLWRRIREADAFVTLMPETRGVAPLLVAFFARRPRYMLMQATSAHFRSWRADGRFLEFASRVVINCLGAVSTKVFVQGSDLRHEFVWPQRRKCVEVMMSTLTEDDFQEPTSPNAEVIGLLTVSRLVQNKRVDVIARTTRLLLDRGLDVRVTHLGEGPCKGDIENLVRELDIEDHFVLAGLVDDPAELRKYYASASLFVLSSETEGVSLAVMEAMAAGTPVIVTAPGGMKAFLRDGIDSIVVPGPDPEAFADAIQEIISDPQTYMRIAGAAQEKVKPYSNEAWARSIESVIRQELERHVGTRRTTRR
jgi:glycosyltransferase involved in cell wall biosynthesis